MTEHQLQSKCFLEFWNKYPQHRKKLFAVNNNSHNRTKGSFNKALGVVPGISDMILVAEHPNLVFLEFKIDGGKQSDSQKEFESLVTSLGWVYRIIWNEYDFWDTVKEFLPL